MPIIINNGEVYEKKVEPKAPPTPVVRTVKIEPETVEEPSRYHEIHDGDLHKLINKKSEYLRDMLDLENNK